VTVGSHGTQAPSLPWRRRREVSTMIEKFDVEKRGAVALHFKVNTSGCGSNKASAGVEFKQELEVFTGGLKWLGPTRHATPPTSSVRFSKVFLLFAQPLCCHILLHGHLRLLEGLGAHGDLTKVLFPAYSKLFRPSIPQTPRAFCNLKLHHLKLQ
jgi:hypothetical protein